MARMTKQEIGELTYRLIQLREVQSKAKLEADAILEKLNKLGPTKFTNGQVNLSIIEMVDWQHPYIEKITTDFPISDFPEIYEPKWGAFKEALQSHFAEKDAREEALKTYAPMTTRLTATKVKKA